MTHLRRLGKSSPLDWVSLIPPRGRISISSDVFFRKISSLHENGALFAKNDTFVKWVHRIAACGNRSSMASPFKGSLLRNARGFCTDTSPKDPQNSSRSPRMVAEAQNALMDYLHITRGLTFTDAEHVSKNSPAFLEKLLKKVEQENDISWALTRFFRYHPINEFEPFFESLGLKPWEFDPLLPRDLMFLADNEELLDNYHVLCNYGIARGKMGKIYKEAAEVFRYGSGVLASKLQAYEGVGLSKVSVIMCVSSSPILLVGGINMEFVKVLEELEAIGIQRDWMEKSLSERNSYNWRRVLILLQFFTEMGLSKEDQGTLIKRHPNFLLEGSFEAVCSLAGFLVKLGGTRGEIVSLFSQFPQVQLRYFIKNVRCGLQFLIEIEMDEEDIRKIMCSHIQICGSYSLKKPNTILTNLNVGKRRLCGIIKDNPHNLKNFARGVKIIPLPAISDEKSLLQKREFLLQLGFVEGSKEMMKALKEFRGKGDELQDRYDFFVKKGFEPDDVCTMIKMAPNVLNQKIDVLESKIDFLINGIGYPLSSLVAFPAYMGYTVARVKLRFLMYNWLKDRGRASPNLALSSLLACSDKLFVKRYICLDPQGPEVWDNFKKSLASS